MRISDWSSDVCSSDLPSERDLAEIYLPAFRRTIVDGKAESLMCAYNAVFGTAACANPRLLQDILRKDWGFTGFVTSECGAIDAITAGHRNPGHNAEGAAMAAEAGAEPGCERKAGSAELTRGGGKGGMNRADTVWMRRAGCK